VGVTRIERATRPREPGLSARQIARFGDRLRELRTRDAGEGARTVMSQRELGRLTGLSASTVGQLERGLHEPTLSTLLALRDALGLGSVEELLGPMPSERFTALGGDEGGATEG
jgi:DNA-binding XRE family transcriptional regulator